MRFIPTLLIALLLLLTPRLAAQTDTAFKLNSAAYVIKTTDGNTVVGTILDYDQTVIVIKSNSLGAVTVQRSAIVTITELNGNQIKIERIWHENPGATQYFFGSSAIPVGKYRGYYQNMYLFIQAAEFGFTKNISVKVGTELFSAAFDGDPPVVYCFAPRIGYQIRPKIYVGGGVLYSIQPAYGRYRSEHRFMPVGMITFGNRDNNATINIGWAFARSRYFSPTYPDPDLVKAKYPTIGFSGMVRLGKWFGLVTENYYYLQPEGRLQWAELYYSGAVRGIGRNFTVDAGLIGSTDWWGLLRIGTPYVSFSIHFPQRKQRPD